MGSGPLSRSMVRQIGEQLALRDAARLASAFVDRSRAIPVIHPHSGTRANPRGLAGRRENHVYSSAPMPPPPPPHDSQPPRHMHVSPAPPPAKPVLGIIALVVGVVALAPIGLAGFNAMQGVRLAEDTTLPLYLRVAIVDADGRRVVIFGVVAAVLLLAGLALGAFGRRSLVAQIAMGVLGLELLGVGSVGIYSRKMPTSSQLSARADAEKTADEPMRAADAPPAPPRDARPKLSNRMIAYALGTGVGQTVLGRANGVAADVVQRLIKREDTLARALDVRVSPFPELTDEKSLDSANGLDYILNGGGKSLTRDIYRSFGAGPAALVELGMKTSIVRMMYFPRASPNAAYIAVLDRTSKAANLKTSTIAAASARIKASAPRSDVFDALDAMEEAIKTELNNEGSDPVGTTSVTAADLFAAPAAAAAVAAKPAPAARAGAAQVSGGLPPEVVQQVVRTNSSRFRLCYENGLRSNPDLEGTVTTRFVINRSGGVSTTADSGSTLPDRRVVQCVNRAFSALSFPHPKGGIVTVRYPITFEPGQ